MKHLISLCLCASVLNNVASTVVKKTPDEFRPNGEANSFKFGNATGMRNTTIVSSHGKIPMASIDVDDAPGNLRYTITASGGRFYFTPTEAINPRD